jgi:hypothetical protein
MNSLDRVKEKMKNYQHLEQVLTDPLYQHFLSLEDTPDFAFDLALSEYEVLEREHSAKSDFFETLTLDIIHCSIAATFYQELLKNLAQDPDNYIGLIEEFAQDAENREQVISPLSELHLQYVQNRGECLGCEACADHADLDDLVAPYHRVDIPFFINLFIVSKTIQFAVEQIIYDLLPENPELIYDITTERVERLRQSIAQFVEKRLE